MQHPQSTNAPLKTFGRLVKANDTHLAKVISEDEARRIASNIAKLPLGKGG
jgi:hypothetical protein